jgi:secreted Zn-dependent insulinase-like peptidase
MFLVVRDELRKTALSKLNLIPHMKGFISFFSIVMKDYVNNRILLKFLESIKYEEFSLFYKSIFNRMYIKSFIHGNASKNEALAIFNESIKENFVNTSPILIKDRHYKNFQANIKGYYIFREKILNKINVNHAILNFYQLGQKNLRNLILAYLIKFLCGNIYFTQLRIKEQLGYITKGKIVALDDVIVIYM